MTIPLPPALPPHFNIGGYKITALVESGPDYHLYQALSPEGHAVLIREFCPGGLVTRDLASGELAVFPENESQFAQAREAFETQYAANAESKLRGFGTVLFLYPLSPAQPQPAVAHAQALRPAKKPQQPQLRKPVVGATIPGTPLPRVKHSGGFPVITVIVTGMLALFGFLGYQILKDKEEPVAKAVTVPVPAPPKPKSKPAPPKPEPPVLPVRYDLSTRGVDPELFPFRTWARLQKELLYSSPQLLTHGDAQGDPALRQALAEYLSEYRGVQCGPHQIVVGAGLEYLLGLLAPLLPGPAAVETPGYPRALQVLQNNGVHCCCLPVDEDGLSVEALNRSDAAVCYVTPSHQFPTGVTMPAGRRAELLHWAARRPGGRYIIEDDYDSEFRFDTRPLPSLQGMAGADGPVVYLSTCSRSLAPSIRIAYMVLPEHLLPAWRKKYRLYSGTVSRFEQQTLARFITEGYFTRHLARERVAYKARRDALAAALNTAFAPGELTLAGLHTGLNLLAKLKAPPPDAALRCAAEAEGVQLSLLSDYDLTGEAPSAAGTLVLGYGSLKDEACASVGETLKKVCMAAREASVTV